MASKRVKTPYGTVHVDDSGTTVWASVDQVAAWASRPGSQWPASTLRGHRVRVDFCTKGDLYYYTIDGRDNYESPTWPDIDSRELDAIVTDAIGAAMPAIVEHSAKAFAGSLPAFARHAMRGEYVV